jgi:hypothetical protein
VTVSGTIRRRAVRANPGFATGVVVVALAAVGDAVTVASVQGFGFLAPGEVRIYLEMVSADPNPGVISYLRYGGTAFPG